MRIDEETPVTLMNADSRVGKKKLHVSTALSYVDIRERLYRMLQDRVNNILSELILKQVSHRQQYIVTGDFSLYLHYIPSNDFLMPTLCV